MMLLKHVLHDIRMILLVINQRTNIIKKDLEHNYFHELLVDHHLRVRHG